MIDLDKLRKSKGYMLAIVNTQTGEYKPVSEDITQVIRCKDCTYQSTSIDGQKVCMLPNGYTPLGYDEGFCSMAERKDDRT